MLRKSLTILAILALVAVVPSHLPATATVSMDNRSVLSCRSIQAPAMAHAPASATASRTVQSSLPATETGSMSIASTGSMGALHLPGVPGSA